MRIQVWYIIFATCFTWYNIIRWVPQILSSPIVSLALFSGLLLIVIGVFTIIKQKV